MRTIDHAIGGALPIPKGAPMKRGWLALALLLAGCGGKSTDPDIYNETGKPSRADNAAAAAVESGTQAHGPRLAAAKGLPVTPPPVSGAAKPTIPVGFLGRWGITPEDCDLRRDDAKGAMRVDPDQLTFYESKGRVTNIVQADAGRIVLDLSYKGEGQTWTTRATLALIQGGTRLQRIEGSPPATYTYQKC